MVESARLALQYVAGRSEADLQSDVAFADAVMCRIQIVGEAARHVSEAFKSTND